MLANFIHVILIAPLTFNMLWLKDYEIKYWLYFTTFCKCIFCMYLYNIFVTYLFNSILKELFLYSNVLFDNFLLNPRADPGV